MLAASHEESGRSFQSVYNSLLDAFGPQKWWPAETPFEVMVGAILTQNTAWGNVEQAIQRLRNDGPLTAKRLMSLPVSDLEGLIRPSGTFRVKARRLRAFLRFFLDGYDGDLERIRSVPSAILRRELLEVNGIGRETADAILLYALGVPSFVVDAYTKRVFGRLGLLDESMSYEEIRHRFEKNLPRDSQIYNEYHALIVRTGKMICRPEPRCGVCPLSQRCPGPDRGSVSVPH